jgi:hypothetical protein
MIDNRRVPQSKSVPPADGDPRLKRRSSRLTIDIPVEVICKGPQNKVRIEESRTFVVSAHGCALTLKTGVIPGDTIVVIHKISREEINCKVIMCRQGKEGGWDTGVEFQSPSPNFWHIAFPPDDWDPSHRDENVTVKVNK